MEADEEVLEYYRLSRTYLEASLELIKDDLHEPALFNAIHALELGIKSALLTKIDNSLILHQVGGLFGREFRDRVGNEVCRRINDILSMYNLPRYPGTEPVLKDEAESAIEFIEEFILDILPAIIEPNNSE